MPKLSGGDVTEGLLKAEGWIVMHIMGIEQIIEHPYTRAARIINGKLSYSHPVNGDECN